MTEKTYSINSLSEMLGRDRRTIRKSLKLHPAEGETKAGDWLWSIETAKRALQILDGVDDSHDINKTVIAEAETAASDMLNSLARLEREPDIERRRKMVIDGLGRTIGRCNDALQATLKTTPYRAIHEITVDYIIGEAVGRNPDDFLTPGMFRIDARRWAGGEHRKVFDAGFGDLRMNEKGAEREQTGIDEAIREPQKRFSANC